MGGLDLSGGCLKRPILLGDGKDPVRAIGSFASRGHEKHASLWFKRRGMGMAALEAPACETTGLGRHVADVAAPAGIATRRRERPPGAVAVPASRNDPCPCGSGERYKHCHGLPG